MGYATFLRMFEQIDNKVSLQKPKSVKAIICLDPTVNKQDMTAQNLFHAFPIENNPCSDKL